MTATELLASPEDLKLVDRLRAGDENAFMMLVEQTVRRREGFLSP